MNNKDIQEMQGMRDNPAVSILSTTHRTAPANAADLIQVGNLVREAQARLLSDYPRREIESLLERLEFLVEEVDWRYTLDGLVLYASNTFAASFHLPFPVRSRVVVGEGFATRDLVFAFNRSPRYRVLVLSEQPSRLFDAQRDSLEESTVSDFPLEHTRPGGALRLPGGDGINSSALRDEHDRHFFRGVDAALSQAQKGDELPVVVVGVRRNLDFFDEVTQNTRHIVARVEGSHDSTPPHELGQLVWPAMQQREAAVQEQELTRLDEAIGAKKCASGLVEAWQMTREGRGDTLLVEENFHCPAKLLSAGLILPVDALEEGAYLEDAVDNLIGSVLQKGGRVVFVDDSVLEKHRHLALILRW